jgi:hypothetical protein
MQGGEIRLCVEADLPRFRLAIHNLISSASLGLPAEENAPGFWPRARAMRTGQGFGGDHPKSRRVRCG